MMDRIALARGLAWAGTAVAFQLLVTTRLGGVLWERSGAGPIGAAVLGTLTLTGSVPVVCGLLATRHAWARREPSPYPRRALYLSAAAVAGVVGVVLTGVFRGGGSHAMGAEGFTFLGAFAIAAAGCGAAAPILAGSHPAFPRASGAEPHYGHYLLAVWFWCYLLLHLSAAGSALADPELLRGEADYLRQFEASRLSVFVEWLTIETSYSYGWFDRAMIPFTLAIWLVSRLPWLTRGRRRLRLPLFILGASAIGVPIVLARSSDELASVVLFSALPLGIAASLPFATGAVGRSS